MAGTGVSSTVRVLGAAAVATAVAVLGDRVAVRAVRPGSRWARTNHTGRAVTLAEGPVAVTALLAGVGVDRLLGGSAHRSLALLCAGAGAGAVGAYDDLVGSTQAKGFRGHLTALRGGTVTSGMVKIVGVGVSAAVAAAVLARGRSAGLVVGGSVGVASVTGGSVTGGSVAGLVDVVVDTALIAGTANLTNLFDLRPGRAAKVVLILGGGLVGVGSAPAVGAALGSLPTDLAARSMMGDCGANALGAAVAAVAADALPRWARLVVLTGVVSLNAASERVSFTAVIQRVPALRWADHLGRTATRAAEPR